MNRILTSVRRWVPDNIARHVRVDRRLTLNGRLFKIPIRDGIGFDHLSPREEWLDVVLRTLLPKRQGTFIDVGVNIGQTLLKVKSFDDGRPYVGFEPNPICCCYCDDLIRLNNIRQVTIVPSGLSDKAGMAILQARSSADTHASLIAGFRRNDFYTQSSVVVVLPGDETLSRLQVRDVALIKIDVEGGELEVMLGLEYTIRTQRPYVVCEVLPLARGPAMRQSRRDTLIELLTKLDYRIYQVLPDARVTSLATIESHADLTLRNYAFVPVEREREFTAGFSLTTA